MGFDLEAARKEGHSDDEILSQLAADQKFDITGALNAGHSKQDILNQLVSTAASPETSDGNPGWREWGTKARDIIKGLVSPFGQPKLTYNPNTKTIEGPGPLHEITDAAKGLWGAYSSALLEPDSNILQRAGHFIINVTGGDAQRAQELYNKKDYIGAAADAFLGPASALALGKFSRYLTPSLSLPPTAEQAAAGADLVSRGVREGQWDLTKAQPLTPFPFQWGASPHTDVAVTALPMVQQAYRKIKANPEAYGISKDAVESGALKKPATRESPFQKRTDYVGDIQRGSRLQLTTFSEAVNEAEAPLKTALDTYGGVKVPGVQEQIASDLDARAKEVERTDPALAQSVSGLAKQIRESDGSVSSLNNIKVHANKELDNLIGVSKDRQIAVTAQSVYAYQYAADAIRRYLYPELSNLGGPDLIAAGTREAATIQARNGVYNDYMRSIAPAQAARESMTYLDYVINGSLYKTHVLRRLFDVLPTPMGEFNRKFNKYIGQIGRGFTPETVSLEGMQPESYPFSIPEKQYQGEVPIPNSPQEHTVVPPQQLSSPPPAGNVSGTTPLTSRKQVKTQLGAPVAGTVPDQIKTVQTPEQARGNLTYTNTSPQYRTNELGIQSVHVPTRAIEGPPSVNESSWRYATPDSPESGMATSNPDLVRKTVSEIESRMEQVKTRLQSNLPPSIKANFTDEMKNLANTRIDLKNQLAEYEQWSAKQPQHPVKVNITPMKPGANPSGKMRYRFLLGTAAINATKNLGQ